MSVLCVLDVLCNLSELATALCFLDFKIVLCEGLMMICDSSISGELIMSCASGSFCCLMSVLGLFASRFARKVSEFSVKFMLCEVF